MVMDNCGGHTVKELELTQAFDVHVLLLSLNCASVLQPLDAGIISHSSRGIKRLLTFHNLPMPEQDRLKNEAKKKQRGTCGLDHGCKARALDAMVMAKQASMKIESARNCWRKTGLLEGKPGGAGAFDSKCRRWRQQP